MYTIYTDGACQPNPGKGGWAYVILKEGIKLKEGFGKEKFSTNNRMEITAVIEALKVVESLKVRDKILIKSDSSYVVNAFVQRWVEKWVRNHWMKGRQGFGQPVKNDDLWKQLYNLVKRLNVSFVQVLGHNGDRWNEYCDQIAEAQASGFKSEPFDYKATPKPVFANVYFPEEQYACPECLNAYTIRELEPYQFEDDSSWFNCPNCGIGQHKDNWLEKESKLTP